MLLNPYRFGSGSTVHSPALDYYTTSLWGAYGMQRLLTAYTGPLIRIRDTTTATETDIGYDANNLVDQAAIASAIGSNSATVVKFYDQTGNSRTLDQSGATGKQPRIVNAGVIDASTGSVLARFDGTDDCMQTPNLPGTNTGMTYVMYGALRSLTGSFNLWLESTADSGSNAGMGLYVNIGNTRIEQTSGTPSSTNFIYQNSTDSPSDDVTASVGDRTASGAANIGKYYKAGVLLTPVGSSAGTNTGNYDAAPLNVGARNNGAAIAAFLNLKALAVYTAAKNGTDIAGISSGLLI